MRNGNKNWVTKFQQHKRYTWAREAQNCAYKRWVHCGGCSTKACTYPALKEQTVITAAARPERQKRRHKTNTPSSLQRQPQIRYCRRARIARPGIQQENKNNKMEERRSYAITPKSNVNIASTDVRQGHAVLMSELHKTIPLQRNKKNDALAVQDRSIRTNMTRTRDIPNEYQTNRTGTQNKHPNFALLRIYLGSVLASRERFIDLLGNYCM